MGTSALAGIGKNALYVALGALVIGAMWLGWSSYTSMEARHAEELRQKGAADAAQVSAQEAAKDAVKSVNPFQATNPLSKVKADPFEKTRKVLNPF